MAFAAVFEKKKNALGSFTFPRKEKRDCSGQRFLVQGNGRAPGEFSLRISKKRERLGFDLVHQGVPSAARSFGARKRTVGVRIHNPRRTDLPGKISPTGLQEERQRICWLISVFLMQIGCCELRDRARLGVRCLIDWKRKKNPTTSLPEGPGRLFFTFTSNPQTYLATRGSQLGGAIQEGGPAWWFFVREACSRQFNI